jgi:hypothetical protein
LPKTIPDLANVEARGSPRPSKYCATPPDPSVESDEDNEGEEEMDMDMDDSEDDGSPEPVASSSRRNPYPLEGKFIDEDDREK